MKDELGRGGGSGMMNLGRNGGWEFVCEVESVEEEEGLKVFVKDDDDFLLKKEVMKI